MTSVRLSLRGAGPCLLPKPEELAPGRHVARHPKLKVLLRSQGLELREPFARLGLTLARQACMSASLEGYAQAGKQNIW